MKRGMWADLLIIRRRLFTAQAKESESGKKKGTDSLAVSCPINSQSELRYATLPCFSSVPIFVRAQ